MKKYGFLNGVPIEAGKGWEIVPEGTMEDSNMEYFDLSVRQWVKNVVGVPRPVEYWLMIEVLAFRRPIKREETNSASLREAELRLEIQQRGNVLAMEELARQATEAELKLEAAQSQLTTLRTALAAAEGAWKESLCIAYSTGYGHGHNDTVDANYVPVFREDYKTYHADVIEEMLADDSLPKAQSALTLIKASKAVGE